MLVQLTRLGISSDAAPAQLRSARQDFAQHNYLRLPDFIEPGLLRVMQRHMDGAGFEAREHSVGSELALG